MRGNRMVGQRNLGRRIGRRLFCGFFCVSLFLSDASSMGLTAWAAEPDAQTTFSEGSETPVPGEGEGVPEQPDEKPEEGEKSPEQPAEKPEEGEKSPEQPDEKPEEGEGGPELPVEIPEESVSENDPEESVSENEPEASVSENSPEESVSENTMTEDTVMNLMAAAGNIASGANENGKVAWVIDAKGKLTVQGEGEIDRDYYGRTPWESYCEQITSAKIELKGTMDLSMLFYGCKNLKTVDVSGMDTSDATNMRGIFWNCDSLTGLDVSGFDTSKVTTMESLFCGCKALTRLDVSGFDTANVTNMADMFLNCQKLTILDVSGFDTSNVTAMWGMFSCCQGLTTLDLSHFDTGKVTDMSNMFFGCDKLTALDLNRFDTSNVTAMWGMFSGCQGLTELDLSHFDTGKVTNMSNMFWTCENLTTLDLSGFDTSNVTSMETMFTGCRKLTELDLSSFDTSNVTSMRMMFCDCQSLPELDLSSFDVSKAMDMYSMFCRCDDLSELDLSGFNTKNAANMVMMFEGCKSLIKLDLSGFDTSNVTDMRWMFEGCTSLTRLDLSHFNTAKVTNMRGMFNNCANLAEVDVSSFDTSQVTDMNAMFSWCVKLKELDLSNFNTSRVEMMGDTIEGVPWGMFRGCESLERLDVSSFDTRNVKRMEGMFQGCSSLKELDLSSFYIGQLTSTYNIQDLLLNCRSLEVFYTPKNVQAHLTFPKAKDGDVWYGRIDGEVKALEEAVEGLEYSVLMMRNKKDVQVEEKLNVTKGKTVYLLGESLSVDDLRVAYYEASGAVRKLAPADYTTNIDQIDMSAPGEKELTITYMTPGGTTLSAVVVLRVTEALTAENTTVTLPETQYVYTGSAITPEPVVKYQGTELTAGTDYTVSYRNHINASPAVSDTVAKGKLPTVIVTGTGKYSGKLTAIFSISKAPAPDAETLEAGAADCESAQSGRRLGLSGTFRACGKKTGYQIMTVEEDDTISGEVFARTPVDADIRNDVFTYDTKAGTMGDFATVTMKVSFANYEDAVLSVKITLQEDAVMYTVTLDWMGHGSGKTALAVRAGSLLELAEEEQNPGIVTEDGGQYLFAGWYRDKAFVKGKEWNFAADTVQGDMTLFACWLHDSSAGKLKMYIQDIEDLTYTGSALKPTVIVYDSDGTTMLKAGRDYTVKYYNNTNAGGSAESGAVAKAENLGKKGQEKFTPVVPGRGDGGNAAQPNFDSAKPYIAVVGSGNYEETVCKNFCIRPAQIAGEDGAPAAGVTLRYADQLAVNAKKEQKPLQSLKYKRAMKAGTDFTVSLGVENGESAFDETGKPLAADWMAAAIPKGYSGTFLMRLKGTGNYAGEIRQIVCVADSAKLLKNAKIALGRNQKAKAYQNGGAVTLRAGYYDAKTKKNYAVGEDGSIGATPESNANDIFTVKIGKEYLVFGRDYAVDYRDNTAVGTATMTITGMGEYTGKKNVTFKITGERFAANTVDVKAYDTTKPEETQADAFRGNMPYTGRAIIQNKVALSTKVTRNNPKAKPLTYGEHYTISYKNNIKKGTATMTFTAKPESGYSGSFKKTFQIGAVNIADKDAVEFGISSGAAQTGESYSLEEKKDEKGQIFYQLKGRVDYSREGAKPSACIALSLLGDKGRKTVLKEGTDYTVSYAGNTVRQADEAAKRKQPVMTVKGKGNYTGSVKIVFSISDVAMRDNPNLTVTAAPTAFGAKKQGDYAYQPRITVRDGKKALGKQDYTVTYHNNTQKAVRAWLDALGNGTAGKTVYGMRPYAEITAVAGSGYDPAGGKIVVDLPVYETKLAANTLYVVVDEEHAVYTGRQLTPAVTVYYGEAAAVREAKAAGETDAAKLTKPTAQGGLYGLTALTEKTGAAAGDYTLGYGANTAAGKNQGSVTITGTERYGGSVTVRFEIRRKAIIYM